MHNVYFHRNVVSRTRNETRESRAREPRGTEHERFFVGHAAADGFNNGPGHASVTPVRGESFFIVSPLPTMAGLTLNFRWFTLSVVIIIIIVIVYMHTYIRIK